MYFNHNCIAYHRSGQYFISRFTFTRDLRQLPLDEKLGLIEAMFGVDLAKSFEELHQNQSIVIQTNERYEAEEELELEEVEEVEVEMEPLDISYEHL